MPHSRRRREPVLAVAARQCVEVVLPALVGRCGEHTANDQRIALDVRGALDVVRHPASVDVADRVLDALAPLGGWVAQLSDATVPAPHGCDALHRCGWQQAALLGVVVDEIAAAAADNMPELGTPLEQRIAIEGPDLVCLQPVLLAPVRPAAERQRLRLQRLEPDRVVVEPDHRRDLDRDDVRPREVVHRQQGLRRLAEAHRV